MPPILSERDQIFVTLLDNMKIIDTINSISTPSDLNSKLTQYLLYQSHYFLRLYYPRFQVKSSEIYTFPYLPRWYFLMLITNPNTNHPFLLFVNLDDNKIWVIRPIGKDQGQVELSIFFAAIPQCTPVERFALYLFTDRTINIRKNAILYIPQFTLIDCHNITNCIRKMHEIDKMKISRSEKISKATKYDAFYKQKAGEMLQKYFTLLEGGEYDDAFLFLKGKTDKYFGKERLNTFFKDTRIIIGHLQIFIELYRLANYLRVTVSNVGRS